jgi:hypothetical protein
MSPLKADMKRLYEACFSFRGGSWKAVPGNLGEYCGLSPIKSRAYQNKGMIWQGVPQNRKKTVLILTS